jgi:hypothetical protein
VWAYVFKVPGYDKLWATITSAGDLSAAQVLAANAARSRQEDGFRDDEQCFGMEEYRAWTKEPILRTFQVQMLALTLLRLMQFRWDATRDPGWRTAAPWNPEKKHASLLDLRRLFWKNTERGLRNAWPLWTTCENLHKRNTTAASRLRGLRKC